MIKRTAARGDVLARAYELYITTDLTYAEIERALKIRAGTLEYSLSKVDAVKLYTTDDKIYHFLLKHGKRRRTEILSEIDAPRVTVFKALQRLSDAGRIKKTVCMVDKRVAAYMVAR